MLSLEQIHPLLIHFPIVFFLSLFVLDLYAAIRNIPLAGRGGVANLSAGLAFLAGTGATIAAIFGDIALDIAKEGGVAEAVTETHETLGGITASAFAVWGLIRAYLWYRQSVLGKRGTGAIVFVELILAALIIVTAYYGGQLVYEFGVNVNIPAS
ncbi:MAG: DUF2231 domain-containing protein [Rhizobiaceae bacterium]|nr:DUF2231 domain-containing protein [Rhizobiaceae bacterium]